MTSLFEVIRQLTPDWLIVLYGAIVLFFALPIFFRLFKETLREYRELIGHTGLKSATNQVESHASLQEAFVSLQAKVEALDPNQLAKEIVDLRTLISNSPKEMLTLQRMRLEHEALQKEVASMRASSRWLVGTIITMALGVFAIIVAVVLGSSGNG